MHPALQAIYDELPEVLCRGLCHTTCGPVPASPLEREEIAKLTGKRVKSGPGLDEDSFKILRTRPGTLSCSYLKKERCTVYSARPLVCRVYGVAEGLRCQYGCIPERVLPKTAVFDLLERLKHHSGQRR